MLRRRTRRRLMAFIVVAAGSGLGLVLLACHFSRSERAALQAVRYLAETNYAQASLCARRALQINSNCVVACRVMAELAEQFRAPQGVYWRQRVLELEPNLESNHVALARTALLLDQLPLATQALSAAPEQWRAPSADYHLIASQVAFARGDIHSAERHLVRAVEIQPANPVPRHNLDIVRLHSSDTNVVQTARRQLLASRGDPVHGSAILRALAREALSRQELDQALEMSSVLQERNDADFNDRILHLSILQQWDAATALEPVKSVRPAPRFSEFLLRTEREACRNPGHVALLANWLTDQGLAETTLPWLETISNEIRSATCVRLAETGCYLALKKWRELAAWLAASHWAADDHLRHALLALTYRQHGQDQLACIEWKRAVRASRDGSNSPLNAQTLVRLAGAWDWDDEAEKLLWDLASAGSDPRWALAVLRRSYEIGGDTRSLLRVFAAIVRQDPANLIARNNLAASSLLLRTNLPAAYQIAQEIHAAAPTNAAIACTYAYSLHLQGRTDEGLKVLSQFPEETFRQPSAAAYYALLLAAQGSMREAENYLAFAKTGFLLPEEKIMLESVAKQVGRKTGPSAIRLPTAGSVNLRFTNSTLSPNGIDGMPQN